MEATYAADRKDDSEPREEDKELTLEKEKLHDLGVPGEQGEDGKGGLFLQV